MEGARVVLQVYCSVKRFQVLVELLLRMLGEFSVDLEA